MSATAPGGFLETMARSAAARVTLARASEPEAALRTRAAARAPPPRLRLAGGFDLIAELKLRSPAAGVLSSSDADLEQRVAGYARGGAAIVSVLTEPERFAGSLEHLARASAVLAPLGVPTMRKDFVVDPYQLLEARAAGAGGALLIVRMLGRAQLDELLVASAELGLFVLLEAFDAEDIGIATELARGWSAAPTDCLIGVNSRNLRTLEVIPERLEALSSLLPPGHPRVAESGLACSADAARLAAKGFTLALVGSALMSAQDPEALARAMILAGRRAASR